MRYIKCLGLLAGLFIIALTGCSDALDAGIAGPVAGDALEAAGTAYEASVQEAEQQIMALTMSFQALTLEGTLPGVTGSATWSGTIGSTTNLELNYVITFTDYSVVTDGVQITGDLAVAVSESSSDCSGAWNTNNLLIFDPIDKLDFALSTDNLGLILSGSLCDIMSLNGQVDIRGDAIGNRCSVSGTTANPHVAC